MKPLSPDTHTDAERIQVELLRQAPPWRKLQLVGEMTETCQTLALSRLRERYPSETPDQLRRPLAALLLGREAAASVYGEAPE